MFGLTTTTIIESDRCCECVLVFRDIFFRFISAPIVFHSFNKSIHAFYIQSLPFPMRYSLMAFEWKWRVGLGELSVLGVWNADSHFYRIRCPITNRGIVIPRFITYQLRNWSILSWSTPKLVDSKLINSETYRFRTGRLRNWSIPKLANSESGRFWNLSTLKLIDFETIWLWNWSTPNYDIRAPS